MEEKTTVPIDFPLPNDLPAKGYVADAGFGELTIHVTVNPIGDVVSAGFAGFDARDAFAVEWLERRRGAWLQSATTSLNYRRVLLHSLSAIAVDPNRYGDRGRVIF